MSRPARISLPFSERVNSPANSMGWVVFFILSLFLSGCSHQHSKSLERQLIHRSLDKHPAWITQLPANAEYFYALGISTDAPSLKQGRLLAAKNAVVEVSNYLGLRASGRLEIRSTELTTRILNEVSITTSVDLKRSRLSQMYYEEFRYEDAEEQAHTFDVYILLRIPMADLQREQKRQQLKKNEMQKEAEAISLEAQQHLNEGNLPLAWQKWMLALRLIDEEVDSRVSLLQVYKALLTAVEGINLSVTGEEVDNHRIISRAFFSGKSADVPLKDLSLHMRFLKNHQAGKVRNTDQSGQVASEMSSLAGKGLQVRLLMSPYAVDFTGLSSATVQKIQFLKTMLENKVAQYGDVPAKANGAMPVSGPVTGHKTGALAAVQAAQGSRQSNSTYAGDEARVNIDASSNNPYILLGNKQRYNLTIKVDISATQGEGSKRLPLNLAVVIDKSGSMNSDGKFDYTKKATEFLIDHLTHQDYLSIIAYSTEVEVVVPAELVSSKALLKHHLNEVEAEGMTNLSGGLFEGHTQVSKHLNKNAINSILLLSDGIANRGITNIKNIIPYVKRYSEEGIGVSVLGVGDDYNDKFMIELAENSKGNYYYIKNPEDIPGIFSQELTRLINVAAQNISITVKLKDGVHIENSFGRSYTLPAKNTYEFRLGDLNVDDRGVLLLDLSLPAGIQDAKETVEMEVSYNDVAGTGRISTKQYEAAKNTAVDKYIVLTRSIEELERVLESLDRGLYEQALKNIRKTYASIEVFARGSEDAEFLQRLKLLKHFEHEILEQQESGSLHGHDEELQKNLNYKLYLEKHSHRNVNHPLHISD